MKVKVLLQLVLFFLVCITNTIAQDKKVAQAFRVVGSAPRIDGIVDEAAWDVVEWQNHFVQREPYYGKEPSQKTSFKILYDDDNIYAAIRAWDTHPDSIVSRLSRRDSGDGDAVGIEFDSYNDKQTAFSFIVFSSGVKVDKFISSDGGNEDETWDAIWDAKTSIDEKGWVVEIKIPLNQLRFNNLDKQVWGLQVGRFIFRKQELSLWSPIPRDSPGWVHRFGMLEGLQGVKPRRQIEIAPYVVARAERYEKEEGNPFRTGRGSNLSAGLDAKVGITNDFTLDLTVNPDFGQVEADPSEVNLTAFETYFPEKRPFFIEGRNMFHFQFSPGDGDNSYENLFYSRRIGRSPQGSSKLSDNLNGDEYMNAPENTSILGAAKVTGKTKHGFSVGLMNALTSKEFAEIDSLGKRRDYAIEPLTNYMVGSVSKEYNEGGTSLGFLFTSVNRALNDEGVDFLHSNAYAGGANFTHQWKKKVYYLNAKFFLSYVEGSQEAMVRTQRMSSRYFQRPDATHVEVDSSRTSLSGYGGALSIGKNGQGRWRYMGFVTFKSPELEVNDVGYIRTVDDIFQVIWVGYRINEPFSIFRSLSINTNLWRDNNFAGELAYWGGNINGNFQFTNYWNFGTGINFNGESLSATALRGGPSLKIPGGWNNWAFLSTDGRKDLQASINTFIFWGEQSKQQNINLSIGYKPSKAITMSLGSSYSPSWRELQFVDNIDFNNETRYINASINQEVYALSFRFNYSITPDISVQFYGRPFIAKGKYYNFKRIINSRASSYRDRFHTFTASQIVTNPSNDMYTVDENSDGTPDYWFDNPNFNYRAYQSNLVLRWEFRPGSALFLVWSRGKESSEMDYNRSIGFDTGELFSSYPHDVVLLKLSYRFY
jgi:hypothetical protein